MTQTSGTVDQAQEKAGQVLDQAKGVGDQVTQQAKQQATSQLASQKDRAVDSLVTVAQALRQTGQTLQEQEQPTVAGYVDDVAQRVESMTNYLRGRDIPELLQETQNLARRKPGLFVTGALALGFIGARFLMSSSQRSPTAMPQPGYPVDNSASTGVSAPTGTLEVGGGLDA